MPVLSAKCAKCLNTQIHRDYILFFFYMYMFEMLHVTYIMLRQIHKIINGKVIYCLVRFYAITFVLFSFMENSHGHHILFISWKDYTISFMEIRFYSVSRKSYIILIFFRLIDSIFLS